MPKSKTESGSFYGTLPGGNNENNRQDK